MSITSNILQVSELTKKVRFMLESEINTVWLTGEISNFIAASSGHWYLSIKDSKSQVKCAMFKGNNRRVRISPANGQQVLIKAKVSLYEPRGDFQLIIEQMEDAGEGLLKQQFEQLKNKLNNQGLFDIAHKKHMPKNINTVGIITSPTGAAIQDIISVIKRRNPLLNIIVYPTLVQGQQAALDISKTIAVANERHECEALIVTRGGGSMEDLWSFNEEMVVKAIFNSQLPVISAVGHEIDTTLCDYVADLRAPTPSAAAELISQDSEAIIHNIIQLKQRLTASIRHVLYDHQQKNKQLAQRLSLMHPAQQLQTQQQKVDDLSLRLQSAFQHLHTQKQLKPQLLTQQLHSLSPLKNVVQQQTKIANLQQRLSHCAQQNLNNKKANFSHIIEQLHLVSPLATIARGYAIARDENNQVIRKKSDVKLGGVITLQVSDGQLFSKVIDQK
jgi:exodeoxyribonuclease VII large subunit